eukprot:TRINITY_DN10528_c0_g1_i2.p1 TRINITY_DN10528_c0_g1~~TRINITY_DN10528_c0_g1_i2.p1  ORF type:complete len:304 (+),score=49.40 TRINITY_DN10528_c0_g1_i2:42-953(+)
MPFLRASDRILKEEKFRVENNKEWEEPFFFIQGADTQYGLMYNWGTNGEDGIKYPASNWDQEIELSRLAVKKMNEMRPRPAFFIVCGDLVDAFPDKYPDIRASQVRDLKAEFANLDPEIPMICLCGNHDVGNSPTHQTIAEYRSNFGDDYFYFSFKGVFFIVLNSQFYEDSSNVQDLFQEHEAWLAKVLEMEERKQAKHTILFHHIPWFLEEPDEANQYFNIEPEMRMKKLNQFYDAGIRKIFCGHYHRNAGGFYKDLEVIVTSAIGCQIGPDDHGMRVVKVTEDKIEHKYHPLSDFPKQIEL